jgi:hypothetical protein
MSMTYLITILKCIVGLSILNVWLIQNKKPTKWRGGDAKTIIEEFRVYGLPVWMCYTVGTLKVLLAIGLLASIQYPEIERISALGLAILLTGSVLMHLKIKDPLYKSFPAALFLTMCLIIAFV